MKKFLIFLTCLVLGVFIVSLAKTYYVGKLSTQTNVQPQEVTKPEFKLWKVGNNQSGDNFYDSAVLENGRVWAVGDGLHFSNDYGNSWNKVEDSSKFGRLTRIRFIDNERGWALGGEEILRTLDGGETWLVSRLKFETNYGSFSFYNDKIGYISGGGGMFQKCRSCKTKMLPIEIWKTIDGGETWKRYFKSDDYYNVFDILAVSEKVVVAIANAKTIIRTEDGGKSWNETKRFEDIQDLDLSPDGRIWADGDKGHFYYSEDQGLTWQRPKDFPTQLLNYDWNDIKFADSKRGIAVGTNGKVAITKDGGDSWKEINAEVPVFVNQSDKLIWTSFNGENGMVLGTGYNYRFFFPEN
jgi:photosystem II stability/assembly factor-like uncharacterized protein